MEGMKILAEILKYILTCKKEKYIIQKLYF